MHRSQRKRSWTRARRSATCGRQPPRAIGHPASPWTNRTASPAFAPYELHFCGEFAQTDSASAAVAAFYAAQERDISSSRDEYAGVRGGVAALVRQAQARVQSQLRALAADEPAQGEPERVRTQAGWLLALSSQIPQRANGPGAQEELSLQDGMAAVKPAPNGQMQLIIFAAADTSFGQAAAGEELAAEGDDLIVPLDPKHSPVEQAERMFDRAAKMERAARIIPRRRARLEADHAYLQQLESDLSLAQGSARNRPPCGKPCERRAICVNAATGVKKCKETARNRCAISRPKASQFW